MIRRLILTITFALMFGFGQQGAAVHEISHYAETNPSSQQRDKVPHSQLCKKCLSYSGIASALNVNQYTLPLLENCFERFTFCKSVHSNLTLTYYSARGPPSFS